MSIAPFAPEIRPISWNANSVTNSDIVNPIPPKTPTPTSCIQVTFTGSVAKPARDASQQAKQMQGLSDQNAKHNALTVRAG